MKHKFYGLLINLAVARAKKSMGPGRLEPMMDDLFENTTPDRMDRIHNRIR